MSQSSFSNIDTPYIKDLIISLHTEIHDLDKALNEISGTFIKLRNFVDRKIAEDPIIDPLANLVNAIHIPDAANSSYIPFPRQYELYIAKCRWQCVLWLFDFSIKKFAAITKAYGIFVAGLFEEDMEIISFNKAYRKLAEDYESVGVKVADIRETMGGFRTIIADKLKPTPI